MVVIPLTADAAGAIFGDRSTARNLHMSGHSTATQRVADFDPTLLLTRATSFLIAELRHRLI
jgi:hypothetical protein